MPREYKHFTIHQSKYKLIYKPEHPFSDSKGYVREHRLVMEEHLDRYITKDEVIHHIDGNGLNNSLENLQLLNNSSEHALIHSPKPRKSQEEKELSKIISKQKKELWKKKNKERLREYHENWRNKNKDKIHNYYESSKAKDKI